jgi:hypothetical protein
MATDDKLPATGNGSPHGLTIQIINLSDTPVSISSGQLSGGYWDGPGPMPGDMISAGGTSFANAGSYTALGGTIQLMPSSGGTITITWSWPLGQAVTGSASSSALNGLSLTMGIIATQSARPTQQIFIGESAMLARALELASGS